MTEPSQSKEQLHIAIHRLSSRPPPDICESENNIPVIEQVTLKESGGQILIVFLAILSFIVVIIIALLWSHN
jgi:hypothetical protein